MADAVLLLSDDLVVPLDYGQFDLSTADEDPKLGEALVGQALTAGIAQSGGLVVVLSPHQNNFEMPLRVEVWNARPDDDRAAWQEAFEVHLDVDEHGLRYSSPTLDITPLPVPPGSYHALITGRGFVAIGWPGSTAPGDSWRIRLWPSSGPTEAVRLRGYPPPVISTPPAVFAEAGIAAVARVHRDLNDERRLSGERGTVIVERTMPGTRRRLFKYFKDPSGWLTASGGGSDTAYALFAGSPNCEAFRDARPDRRAQRSHRMRHPRLEVTRLGHRILDLATPPARTNIREKAGRPPRRRTRAARPAGHPAHRLGEGTRHG